MDGQDFDDFLFSGTSYGLIETVSNIFPDASPRYIKSVCKFNVLSDSSVNAVVNTVLKTNGAYPKKGGFIKAKGGDFFTPDSDSDSDSEGFSSFAATLRKFRLLDEETDIFMKTCLSCHHKFFREDVFNCENGCAFCKGCIIGHVEIFFSEGITEFPCILDCSSKFSSNTLKEVLPPRLYSSISNASKDIMGIVEADKNEILYEYVEEQETSALYANGYTGETVTCNCCYDDEIQLQDIYGCEKGCTFCKSCVLKHVEILYGEGKLNFPCLQDCGSSFNLRTLKDLLPKNLFDRLSQKVALAEVKAAGIAELKTCPFCEFATILTEGDMVFICMNPECMKKSCLKCNEPLHEGMLCEEVEKDQETKARTMVENKMTEALLITCYKCKVKYFKVDGCNKVKCSCGASMCYICRKPVKDYTHFNGQGGNRYNLCPLFSNNNETNKNNVIRGAKQAKRELGDVNLKNDPTKDIEEHYVNNPMENSSVDDPYYSD